MEPGNLVVMPDVEGLELAPVGGEDAAAASMLTDEWQAIALLFPAEIWEKILGEVTDPQDLWNCYNTCPVFREILHKWSRTWLFEQALPNLFANLPREKLMACRLVSKGWKDVVDQFLQNHPSLRPHDEKTCNPRTLPFVNPLEEKGLAGVIEFNFQNSIPDLEDQEYLAKTRGKLSLFKAAKVVIWGELVPRPAYWEKIYQFFRIYGEDIWYLSIFFGGRYHYIGDTFVCREKVFRLLFTDLFEFVPNLRKLSASHLPDPIHPWTDEPLHIAIPTSAPHLETLEIRFRDNHSRCPLLAAFLRDYKSQLGKLSLQESMMIPLSRNLVCWPELTELHLLECTAQRLSSILPEQGRTALPNLTKLGLELRPPSSSHPSNGIREMDALVRIVTNFPRLTTLRLNEVCNRLWNKRATGLTPPIPSALCVPSTLKTLEFDYTGGRTAPGGFNFLLHFPQLENLNVYYKKEIWPETWGNGDIALLKGNFGDGKWGRKYEAVKLSEYMFTGEMYKSDVWEVLPQLKVFTFQWDVYTRGEYEEYCRKQQAGVGGTN